MNHIEHQVDKLRANLETLSRTINGSLAEVNNHVDSVSHILEEYTHDRKMESIGLMAGGVAHDFKNFIHIIAVNAGAIQESTTDPKNLRRSRQIVAVCHKASDLVGNMMNLVKNDDHSKSEMDLNREVKKCVNLLKGGLPEGIQIKTEYEEKLPAISGDVTQICQVVTNLVKNGVEAMADEGVIAINTREVMLKPEDCLKHGNARPGHFDVLAVCDAGPGIPPRLLPRIYDPFFSTKTEGGNSGFGLAIVYTIARDHGGWIDVHSNPGKGTCFSLYFPALD